jgi:hypothetical protein
MMHPDLFEININFEEEKKKGICPITFEHRQIFVKSIVYASPFSIISNLKYSNILLLESFTWISLMSY